MRILNLGRLATNTTLPLVGGQQIKMVFYESADAVMFRAAAAADGLAPANEHCGTFRVRPLTGSFVRFLMTSVLSYCVP